MSYLPLKNCALETPLPVGISINLPWGGYRYSLELHNYAKVVYRKNCLVWLEMKFAVVLNIIA